MERLRTAPGAKTGNRPAARLRIGRLADASGTVVTVRGTVTAQPSLSPVTQHPCAAWWCWVDIGQDGRLWTEVGAAAHGLLHLDDGTGRVSMEAAECRLDRAPSAEATIWQAQWWRLSAMPSFEGLRQACRAAGLDRPEDAPVVRVRESLLPVSAAIFATGLVLVRPAGPAGLYRDRGEGQACLAAPQGGWIELRPR